MQLSPQALPVVQILQHIRLVGIGFCVVAWTTGIHVGNGCVGIGVQVMGTGVHVGNGRVGIGVQVVGTDVHVGNGRVGNVGSARVGVSDGVRVAWTVGDLVMVGKAVGVA